MNFGLLLMFLSSLPLVAKVDTLNLNLRNLPHFHIPIALEEKPLQ